MFTLCGLCAVGVTVSVICLNVKKNKKVWRYGFFSLPLHKLSCISAKHTSKLDVFALDLH